MNKIVIIDTGVDINSTYIRKYVKDIVGIKVKKNGETFDVVSTSTDPTCMHSAVLSGRWCGDQRPLCGPAAGECQSVEFGFITTA